jgi:hypothetical protein
MWAAAFAFGLVVAGVVGVLLALKCWLKQDSTLVFKNYGLGDCRLLENLGVYDVTEFGSAEDLRLFCGCDYGYMEDEICAR